MGIRRTLNMVKNTSNWASYMAYKMGGKKGSHFTFQLRNDFEVKVPRQIQPEFKECVFEEIYLKHLPSELVELNHPVILDIGANVGFFTIWSLFKFKHPRVISFEPVKRNHEQLTVNLNKADHSKLTIVNKAVNDTVGELVLKFNSAQDITTSASLFDNQYGSDEEIVKTTTLQEICSDYQLNKIDLLKMDCEGAEYNIIYKTPRSFFNNVNCIAMETHVGKEKNENNDSLAGYLKDLGFNIVSERGSFIWAYRSPEQWK